MVRGTLSHEFYERIKPRLHQRIGRELRLAGQVLDLGCGACELVRYLAHTYSQHVTGSTSPRRTFQNGLALPGTHGFAAFEKTQLVLTSQRTSPWTRL